MCPLLAAACLLAAGPADSPAAGDPAAAYVQLEPLPGGRVAVTVDGVPVTRWHPGTTEGRAFFYPLNAATADPDAGSLLRMGHPGDAHHDHHRGLWFAHHDVGGANFWVANANAIRQTEWLALESGRGEGRMACRLGWFDGDGAEVMTQDLVFAVRPLAKSLADGGYELELQFTLRPAGAEPVTLGQTNFGLLGVRVAESVSEHFGAGRLTDDAGRTGEEAIFGEPARWVDYTGPVPVGRGERFRFEPHGVTVFDHPANHDAAAEGAATDDDEPVRWHVRADGWVGPSATRTAARRVTAEAPLTLRYLLHVHPGPYAPAVAAARRRAFAERPGFAVEPSARPHVAHTIRRVGEGSAPAGPAR